MRPSAYTLDERRYPLVIGRANGDHVHDDAALAETYRQCEALLARERPLVLLFDLRGATSSPARRKRFADWVAAREATIAQRVVAMGIIVGSQVERGFVTAVAWLKPPPVETRVFTDAAPAEQWLLERYAARRTLAR